MASEPKDEEGRSPLLGLWRAFHILVLAVAALIALFSVASHIYQ